MADFLHLQKGAFGTVAMPISEDDARKEIDQNGAVFIGGRVIADRAIFPHPERLPDPQKGKKKAAPKPKAKAQKTYTKKVTKPKTKQPKGE